MKTRSHETSWQPYDPGSGIALDYGFAQPAFAGLAFSDASPVRLSGCSRISHPNHLHDSLKVQRTRIKININNIVTILIFILYQTIGIPATNRRTLFLQTEPALCDPMGHYTKTDCPSRRKQRGPVQTGSQCPAWFSLLPAWLPRSRFHPDAVYP